MPNKHPHLRIDSFTGDYSFLSNSWYSPHPTRFNRQISNDHLFTAAATHDMVYKLQIMFAKSAQQAIDLGKHATPRPDWDQVKLSIMAGLLSEKFDGSFALTSKLIDTGDAQLVAGNNQGDTFWGVEAETDVGLNWLGTLLMIERSRQCEKRNPSR